MKITSVTVRKVENGNPRMKGIASIKLDECFAINGIRIIEKTDGLFAAMPSKKGVDGEFHDICHPINEETRKMFNEAVIDEYNKIKDEPVETKEEE